MAAHPKKLSRVSVSQCGSHHKLSVGTSCADEATAEETTPPTELLSKRGQCNACTATLLVQGQKSAKHCSVLSRHPLLARLVLLLQHRGQDSQIVCSLVVLEDDLLNHVHLKHANHGDLPDQFEHGGRMSHRSEHLECCSCRRGLLQLLLLLSRWSCQ